MGSHPVAVVQYTFTQKQYRERHKTNHTTTQKLERVRTVPGLCGFYPGICLTTEDKERKKPQEKARGKRAKKMHSTNCNEPNCSAKTRKGLRPPHCYC
jgi:hypothetical protein